MAKHKCEVRCHVVCRDTAVRHLTGALKGDPVFWCCMACEAYLKRQGVRMKEAPASDRPATDRVGKRTRRPK